ncbi:hypothetical protein [Streptomyces subrutilus]|uniref:hypothetical protein n=1 Tax=Streptomyces subrutilus TaxID=36818 RepID=UPI002E0F6861|nr:hypothetical protein OG479_27785 [Streptomyces subrutilus]
MRFIAKDPSSNLDNCPTVWVDDEKQEFVIQGWKIDDATEAECLTVGSIPDTETVVRIPVRMAQILREACDVADGTAVR